MLGFQAHKQTEKPLLLDGLCVHWDATSLRIKQKQNQIVSLRKRQFLK